MFAFLHFTTELVVFGTLSWKKALAPLIVAGTALLLPCAFSLSTTDHDDTMLLYNAC